MLVMVDAYSRKGTKINGVMMIREIISASIIWSNIFVFIGFSDFPSPYPLPQGERKNKRIDSCFRRKDKKKDNR